MKKPLKRLAAVVLAAMIMLSVLCVSVSAEKVVYREVGDPFDNITDAVKSFRGMASDWPAKITIRVDKKVIDDLCKKSGFNAWDEFRQQFVANPNFEQMDDLWLYGVESDPYLGGREESDLKAKNGYYTFVYKCALNNDQIKETNEAAEDLAEELKLKNLTDFEKIKAVYDWFTKNVTYTAKDKNIYYSQTPYGALVKHDAVCAGIGLGMEKVLDLVGVDCVYLSGYAFKDEDGLHGWNFVKLNGKYYGLDATWDNGASRYSWFLTGSDTFTEKGNTHLGFGIFGEDNFKKKYKLADKDFLKPGVAGYSYLVKSDRFTSFTAQSLGEGTIRLEWREVSGAKSYTVEKKGKSDKEWLTFTPTKNTVSQITFKGSEDDDNVYQWRVRSDNGAVSEIVELSLKKKSDILGSVYPSVPYITYGVSNKAGAVSLRWTTTDDAEKYILYMSTDGKSYKKIYTTTDGGAQVSKLESGKTYYFALKAVGPDGTTTGLGDTYSKKVTVK